MVNPSGHILLLLLLSSLMSLHADGALSFNYNFSIQADLQSVDLRCINDCSRAGDRIDLTNGTQQNRIGRVYHLQPVRLWNGRKQRASFSTSFSFAIGGEHVNDRGDGMAFFIGPPDLPSDSGSMFLGLFTHYPSSPSQTVGVEFDTCRNDGSDPPNIADHMGIDINSIVSTKYEGLPNVGLYGTMSANITYDGRSKMMKVSLRLEDGGTHRLETPVDFRDAGVPQYANVGFSAATGPTFTESHHLLSWSFTSTEPSNSMLWVILVSVAIASLLGLIAAVLWVITVRGRLQRMKIELPVAKEFSYSELCAATRNFSEYEKIGSGAFGQVYRGELRDPGMPPVAVKRLKQMLDQSRRKRDYITEITTLGELSHRNLIKLVGWCHGRGDDELLLVYELVTNGSLDEHLHPDDGGRRLLAWRDRYRIVLGIGAAIKYLHTGYRNPILHRDIKPSNVMLDDDFQARLGDFGLVRQVRPGQGSSLGDTAMVGSWNYIDRCVPEGGQGSSLGDTTMVGSWNYIDPECFTAGTVSTGSDIYSFGVLLLEVATGKKPVTEPDDENGSIQNTLVNAVRTSYAQGAVLEMADERLNGDFDRAQMERVLLVGLMCAHKDRSARPGIKDAVNLLSNIRHPLPESSLLHPLELVVTRKVTRG